MLDDPVGIRLKEGSEQVIGETWCGLSRTRDRYGREFTTGGKRGSAAATRPPCRARRSRATRAHGIRSRRRRSGVETARPDERERPQLERGEKGRAARLGDDSA